jgi:hypothetical protein
MGESPGPAAPVPATPPLPQLRRAFYCVADDRYFTGLVALLSSLRLVGQQEPLVVLDCGLEEWQRAALEEVALVIPAPGGPARLAKTLAPLALPASEVVAILDADVIAVRPLDRLLERAAAGKVVAFADDQPARFHPEWRQTLGGRELYRHTYVNAGMLLLPGELAIAVLTRVRELHERVDFSHSRHFGPGSMADPFRLPDQDCWNAVLAATVEPGRMSVLAHRLAPFQPGEPARIVDARTLSCRGPEGSRPYLLHHIGPKPWRPESKLPASAYSTLLARLVHGDDVPLALPRPVPLVSVIVPTYQRRATIRRAVESVLAQSCRDLELIVVDDGSDDGTDAALAPLAPLLRYVRQPNRGPAAARNAGIRLARASIVAFLDSDDRWLPDHLQAVVSLLERHGAAVLACTAPAYPRPRTALGRTELVHAFPAILTRAIAGAPSAVAVRRSALELAGGFDESLPLGSEDTDLWRRLALLGPFALMRRRTVVREEGEDSLSARARRDGSALAGYERSVRRLQERLTVGGGEAAAPVRALCRYLDALALLRPDRGEQQDAALERALGEAVALLPALSTAPALIVGHVSQLPGADDAAVSLGYLRALADAWPEPGCSTAVLLRLHAVAAAMRAQGPRGARQTLSQTPAAAALALLTSAAARRSLYRVSELVHDSLPVLRSAASTLASRWERAHPS